ncbi:hypothetical protein BLSTO_01418 [Blastocystis sp. subtype 1]
MKELTPEEKQTYRKWLANGDLRHIAESFGDDYVTRAATYVGRKANEWFHLFQTGFPLPKEQPNSPKESSEKTVRVSGQGRKRVKAPTTTDSTKKRAKKQVQAAIEPTFDNPVPILPRRRVPYRLKYAEFSIGDSVRFVLPAYRAFLEEHKQLFEEKDRVKAESLLSEYAGISLTVVPCRVVGVEYIPTLGDDAVRATLHTSDGQTLTVLALKATSDLLHTAPHLIREEAYNESMQYLRSLHHLFNGIVSTAREELSTGTKICQVFALPAAEGEALSGECYEGCVYDVNEDALENPYQVGLAGGGEMESIHVIWYGKSAISGKWVMDFFQCDNESGMAAPMSSSASPWELRRSKIAEPSSEREQVVRAPLNPEPETILALLRDAKLGVEGANVFEDSSELLKIETYRSSITHPMDFHIIEEKLKHGEYGKEKSVIFWSDLALIAVNEGFRDGHDA